MQVNELFPWLCICIYAYIYNIHAYVCNFNVRIFTILTGNQGDSNTQTSENESIRLAYQKPHKDNYSLALLVIPSTLSTNQEEGEFGKTKIPKTILKITKSRAFLDSVT
jgi:hypothetical protein